MEKIKSIFRKLLAIIIIIGIIFYIQNNDENITQERKIDNNEKEISNIEDTFQIQILDVGEADCILIKDNDNYALIDAGNNEDGKNIVDYFKSLGIKEFKYVFATHPHEDHIGGMDNILKNFSVKEYFMLDIELNNITYTEIIDLLKKKNIYYKTPSIGEIFQLRDSSIEVLWLDNDKEDLNKDSMILKVKYKNTSYLLTGDATVDSEKEILEKDIKSDVLKVGHHGSKYSSSAQFLQKVHPKYAIISVGENNDYDFPKKVVLDKLNYLDAIIYRTDIDGTIIITSDGEKIEISTKTTNTNNEKPKTENK